MTLSARVQRLFEEAVVASRGAPREARDALDRAMDAAGFPPHVLRPPGAQYVVPYRDRVVLRFEELNDTQRAAVAFVLEHPELTLGRHAIPGEHWALREWAGVQTPSALFLPRADGRTPYEVLRALRGRPEQERHAYLDSLPLRARAEVLGRLCFLPADLSDEPNALRTLVTHIDGSLGEWAVASARRILDDAAVLRESAALRATTTTVTLQPGGAHEHRAHDTHHLRLPTYLALVRAGRADDPAFDPLLPTSRWVAISVRRECLAALPESRREAAIIASLSNERFVVDAVIGAQQVFVDYPYPKVAEFLLANGFESPRPSVVIACVRDAAKKHQHLEALIAAFDAALGPVRHLDEAVAAPAPAYETLDEVHREQLRVLSRVWYRRDDTGEQLLAPQEDSPGFEWVRLSERGEVAFEAWLNEGFEGLVFIAGTATHVAHLGQYGVECEDRALLMALRDAFSADVLRRPG